MQKAFMIFRLVLLVTFNLVSMDALAEDTDIDLLYGAHVNIPLDWKDLGSELDIQSEKATIAVRLAEITSADTAPEMPLISLASNSGSPPTMITVLYNDCPEGACPDSNYFENLISNSEEVQLNEKKEQERVDKLNAESGHKTLQHFPMEVKKECDAYYSMAGGQEVAMYGQIAYVSKLKVIYTEDKLLGMTIGYPSADKDNGAVAEKSLASFGCD
ncbi:MAG: hypothetical protein JRE16_09845 [Deltaproteobacteria bacterium]|nr:hypothetical protein [Deltaproteobacteria bacterium]